MDGRISTVCRPQDLKGPDNLKKFCSNSLKMVLERHCLAILDVAYWAG